MSHDAAEQSLAARIRSLNFAPDLKDVLAELAERTEPAPAHTAEFEAMLDRATNRPPAKGPRHKRDRHGMRLITGGLAAVAAAAVIGWRWACKSGAHQATAAVVTAAMAGAAAVPVAVSLTPDPAPATPMTQTVTRQHARHHGPAPALWPVATLPHRRRKHARGDSDARADAAAEEQPQPSPSPTSAVPSPSPAPAVTPTLSPTPAPSESGPVGALRLPGAVMDAGGLLAPPWPNMLQHGRWPDAAP